eukprot:7383888-Prymnesium_polylepis.2
MPARPHGRDGELHDRTETSLEAAQSSDVTREMKFALEHGGWTGRGRQTPRARTVPVEKLQGVLQLKTRASCTVHGTVTTNLRDPRIQLHVTETKTELHENCGPHNYTAFETRAKVEPNGSYSCSLQSRVCVWRSAAAA